jgi:hypothetical protein
MDSLEPFLKYHRAQHASFRDVAGDERIHPPISRPRLHYPDGSPAYLFSSQDQQTVDRHFDWMMDYGIDGVSVQRFVVGVASHPTNVLDHTRKAAGRTG